MILNSFIKRSFRSSFTVMTFVATRSRPGITVSKIEPGTIFGQVSGQGADCEMERCLQEASRREPLGPTSVGE